MSKIAIIGHGNVGYHLANQLSKKNEVVVFSRTPTESHIQPLIELNPHSFDLIILTVPDSVIKEVANAINSSEAIIVHTSGSRPMSDLSEHAKHGVIYPLQTFSKGKDIDFSAFPIFVEGSADAEMQIYTFAKSFSRDVRLLTSSNRTKLHLAAVFACNFSNHMYHIAEKYLANLDMTFQDIQPLVEETLQKAISLNPSRSQTGPAMRNDQLTINTHLEMMEDQEIKAIYQMITDHIQKIR